MEMYRLLYSALTVQFQMAKKEVSDNFGRRFFLIFILLAEKYLILKTDLLTRN